MTASFRMRDVFIEALTARMAADPRIFFLSADFGSPKLDALVDRFPDRFINVGIAEQNLVNVAAGLALEGYHVCAYALAPFITMRCYEQVRTNLALLSRVRPINVTLVGVGAGFSYDVSGPTHQAMEDLSIMRTLPHLEVGSPCDWVTARAFVDHILARGGIRYLRLDGKALPAVYPEGHIPDWVHGFDTLRHGTEACFISTGYMTHKALAAADILKGRGIQVGVADVFLLKPIDEVALAAFLRPYRVIVSIEEAFIGKGGLDALVLNVLNRMQTNARLTALGLEDAYRFEVGNRDALLRDRGLGEDNLVRCVAQLLA